MFAATSYVGQTKTLTAKTDMVLDIVLQRAGPSNGPALLTLHAPLIYGFIGGTGPYTCIPSAVGTDFLVPGVREVLMWNCVIRFERR